MATKDLQILNLKFDQVMFNSLIFTWERNFEVTFGIFSVLVTQINVVENYLNIHLFYQEKLCFLHNMGKLCNLSEVLMEKTR